MLLIYYDFCRKVDAANVWVFFFNSRYAGQNVAFFSELKITRQFNKPKKIRGASLWHFFQFESTKKCRKFFFFFSFYRALLKVCSTWFAVNTNYRKNWKTINQQIYCFEIAAIRTGKLKSNLHLKYIFS